MGMTATGDILVIISTLRKNKMRIIAAKKANKREIEAYF